MTLNEFQAAAKADSTVTSVHFNLGLTYLKKKDYEHAPDEFLQASALALNTHDVLGDVYSLVQQDHDAAKSYREAQRRDPGLINSHIALDNERRAQREKQVEMGTVPSPELMHDQQLFSCHAASGDAATQQGGTL